MFEEARGKKLLIIGGETNIMNIVRQAREMGVYTIVTERGSDLSKLPAKSIADEAWDIDYSDMKTLEEKCRKEGVSGVFSGYSEGKVLYAARLSQILGTPFYVTPEQVEITRNKRKFKELCTECSVPVPREYCPDGKVENLDRDAVEYPVIVKPADYGGRIGITICKNRGELEDALVVAEKNSVTKTVVVEEYLTGMELTSIYTIADGRISLSIINDKYLSREGDKYACLCDVAITPSRFYHQYLENVDARIREVLKRIGVRNGLAGFQFIATPDRIVAFEMGLRLNGGNDWKILSSCNGINHMKMLINYSLTGSMGDDLDKDDPDLKEQMATYVMYAHGGEVGAVDYSNIAGHEGILDVSPYVYVGKQIPDRGTTQQRVISFKIRTDTLDHMADTIHYIQDHVKIEDTAGRNMLFTGFDTQRFQGNS